jgi:hypothetical protein
VRVRLMGNRFLILAATAALGVGLATAPGGTGAVAATRSSVVKAPVFTLPLTEVGQVNLSALAGTEHHAKVTTRRQGAAISRSNASPGRYQAVDDAILAHQPKTKPAHLPTAADTTLTTTNVPGENGFTGLTGIQQASTTNGQDLEPPDQGLCAGNGYVMEFVNDAIAVYDRYGDQLTAPVGSAAAFDQPPSAGLFADPRCYYDAPTKHWFFQELVLGATTSTEFEAVSATWDPTGTYTVYSWDTTDASTAGCPCFGDYDEFGADDNGIYVSTDEFGISSGAYNGSVVYAISKEQLENAAGTGILPPIFGYRLTKDPFGVSYIVAPTSTPPGAAFAPNTEYFVESNGVAPAGRRLEVWALSNTSLLGTPAPPALYRTSVVTESYAEPADATQRPGVRPLGHAYQDPEGGIQADFDAEMEPVYTGGQIYAQLDTGTRSGSDAVDWFIIKPSLSGGVLSATLAHQGRVAVKDTSLLYPYTAVDAQGTGYLLFSLSGPHNYPSPAYISYGSDGPAGPVMQATAGAGPEDGFTCYAAFVGPFYGGCRWGDYSMGVVMNNRVYMGAEMIPAGDRDTLTNWGTYIWSAPPPAAAGVSRG